MKIDNLRKAVLSGSHLQYVKVKMLTATDEEKQEHTIVDRAKDFDKYLRASTPFIQDGELIVGGHSLKLAPGSTLNVGTGDRIHNAPNYAKVLKMGFGGIRKQARAMRAKTSDEEKQNYYKAVDIAYGAVTNFIRQYALLAETMSKEEGDPKRKQELLKVSKVCSAIATEPAGSFQEALQLLWFAALLVNPEGEGPIGRLDQFLYPFYKKDIEDKILTKGQAQELLECLWIKFNMRTRHSGSRLYDTGNNITLGGVTSDGKGAINELTYMCLDATERLKLVEPKVNVRVHEGIEPKLLEQSCRLIRLGLSMPCLYNDRVAIPALIQTGIKLEDAREYTTDGCTELLIPGKSDLSFYICPMIQELHDFLFNLDMAGLSTFEQFMSEFKNHLAFLLKKNCVPVPVGAENHSFSAFFSAMFDDCLLRGIPDLMGGAIYNVRGVVLRGIVNCVDSLAAIKKFIYDEKSILWKELLTALKADFNGHERLRQKLVNGAPKFGNDDDYVDLIAGELVGFLSEEANKYETKTSPVIFRRVRAWTKRGLLPLLVL
jgi:formate C-acetyltransferase